MKWFNNRFVRFAIVGAIAFIIHYAVYLSLIIYLKINIAYTIGYGISLICNLWLSARFTFKCEIDTRKSMGFVLAHAINYFLHIFFLNAFLFLGLNEKVAPIAVLCLVVPVNYILVKFALVGNTSGKMVGKKVLLSFDMEEFDLPIEKGDGDYHLGDGLVVSTEGAIRVIEAIKTLNIHATFFFTANFARKNREMTIDLYCNGNEIASHGCTHLSPSLSDPFTSKAELEMIIGGKCYGYRQPRMQEVNNELLLECGYRYNSSLNPTLIPGRYCHLRSPRTVFSESGLAQVPMSVTPVFRIPLFWLSFHFFPLFVYKFLARCTIEKDGYLVLYFHPWEFFDLGTVQSTQIPTYIKFNTGKKMQKRFIHFVEFLKEAGCEFITIQEFVQNSNVK